MGLEMYRSREKHMERSENGDVLWSYHDVVHDITPLLQ